MARLDWDDVSSLVFGLSVVAALVGSYAGGFWARRFLPARHQTHESLEIVHAVIGMIVAMIAILLGLQLDAATKAFDDTEQLVERYSIQTVQLDALLRDYGPGTAQPRKALGADLSSFLKTLEQGDDTDPRALGPLLGQVGSGILQLAPTTALQSRVQSDSLSLINELFQERWQLVSRARLSNSGPLYGVLVLWLVLVYGAFGLNAPFNVPVFLVLSCSALAIGAAVFVLDDMRTPFGGLITISPLPMQEALARLNE